MSEDYQDRERDVRERIVSLMQSIGQAPRKQITSAELQKLNNAVERLNQILKSGKDADLETLRSAAVRLDRLLSDIRKAKDGTNDLKRRGDGQNSHG